MVCIISFVTDLMRDHMEKTNTIHSVLSSAPHTIVFTGYQEKRKIKYWLVQPTLLHPLTRLQNVCEMCAWGHPTLRCVSTPTCSVVSMMLVWSGPSEGRWWYSYSTSSQMTTTMTTSLTTHKPVTASPRGWQVVRGPWSQASFQPLSPPHCPGIQLIQEMPVLEKWLP